MELIKFGSRIVIGEKVYLRAEDCAYALKYSEEDNFCRNNPTIWECDETYGRIVEESRYNSLYLKSIGKEDSVNLQISKVETLDVKIAEYCKMYPLKRMFAEGLFQYEMQQAGYTSENKFIDEYDLPKEKARILESLKKDGGRTSSYYKLLKELENEDYFNRTLIEELGLMLQFLTVSNSYGISLLPFLVGNNCMWQIADYDEYLYIEFEKRDDELFWMDDTYDSEPEWKQISDRKLQRDFREYSILENIYWVLIHVQLRDEGDWMDCSIPGIHVNLDKTLILNILSNRNIGDLLFIPEIIDVTEYSYITGDK